jgi:hypothetical protein
MSNTSTLPLRASSSTPPLRETTTEMDIDDGPLEKGKMVMAEKEVLFTLFQGMLESVTRNTEEREIYRKKIAGIRSSILPRYVSRIFPISAMTTYAQSSTGKWSTFIGELSTFVGKGSTYVGKWSPCFG